MRFHAAESHIDPQKIGVLGFSAGGRLVAAISTNFAKRLYPVVDAADKESCRPDFGLLFIRAHVVEHLNRLRNRGNCCAYLNSSPPAVWSKSRLDEAGHRGLYNPYWLTLIGSVTKARPQ